MCNKGKVAINDYFLHVKRIRFVFYGIQEGLTDEETEKNDPDDGERMQVLSFMTSFIQFLGFEEVLSSFLDLRWRMSLTMSCVGFGCR